MSILLNCGQFYSREANTEDTGGLANFHYRGMFSAFSHSFLFSFALGVPLWWELRTKHKFPWLAVEWAHETASSFHLSEFYAMHEVCDVTLDWSCETARPVSQCRLNFFFSVCTYFLTLVNCSDWLWAFRKKICRHFFLFFRVIYFTVCTWSAGENFDRKESRPLHTSHKIFIRCAPRKMLYHWTKKLASYGNHR